MRSRSHALYRGGLFKIIKCLKVTTKHVFSPVSLSFPSLSKMAGSSVAMNFMTPEKYSKTQESHFVINTNAVNEFVEIYGPLGGKDEVLDFGSGTGETTAAIAQAQRFKNLLNDVEYIM